MASRVKNWAAILSETQFAVDQACSGVRQLALSRQPESWILGDISAEVQYEIHNAFLSLTTGIERLGKLAVSLETWRETGEFPSVRHYGHDISKIARAIDDLGFDKFPEALGGPSTGDLSHFETHMSLMVDYAKGHQRYEHLDALSSDSDSESLFTRWVELVGSQPADQDCEQLAYVPRLVAEVLYRTVDDQVLIEPYIDKFLPTELDARSLRAALDFHEIARWFGAALSSVSTQIFYHDGGPNPGVPYLSEIIDHRLLHEPLAFAEYEILQLNDLQATLEAIADA